jgi:hypothetical protein
LVKGTNGSVILAENTHGNVGIYEGPGDPTYRYNSSQVSYLGNGNLFDPSAGAPVPVVDSKTGAAVTDWDLGIYDSSKAWSAQHGTSWYQGPGKPVGIQPYLNFSIGNIPDGSSQTIAFAEGLAGANCTIAVSSYSYMPAVGGKQPGWSAWSYNGGQWAGWKQTPGIPPTSPTISKSSWSSIQRQSRFNLGANSLSGYGYSYSYTSTWYDYSYSYKTTYLGPMFSLVPNLTFTVAPNANSYTYSSQTKYTWLPSGTTWSYSYPPGKWAGSYRPASDTSYGYSGHSYSVSGCDPRLAQGNFPGGLLVCLADGSVHFIPKNVSYASWSAAVTPASGDSTGSDIGW